MVVVLILALVYTWYWWDIQRQRESDEPTPLITHPLLHLAKAWETLRRERVLLVVLCAVCLLDCIRMTTLSQRFRIVRGAPAREFHLVQPDFPKALSELCSVPVLTETTISSLPRYMLPHLRDGMIGIALICGAAAWMLFVACPLADDRVRRRLWLMMLVSLGILGFSVVGLQLSLRSVDSADSPAMAWVRVAGLLLLIPFDALLFACSLAALHHVTLGHRWSVARTLSAGACAFLPLLCIQLVVDPLTHLSTILANLPGSREWLSQLPQWLLRADIYTGQAVMVALPFIGWVIVSEQVGWLEACRRNFALVRHFTVPLLVLFVRTAAIFVPLYAAASLVRSGIGGSIGVWAFGVVHGVLDALLLLVVARVYVRLSRIEKAAATIAVSEVLPAA
jgi:hypothetical protein